MLDLTLPSGIRTLTTPETERLREKHPDLPPSPRFCPTCHGNKKFLWWDDPSSTERIAVEYECPCNDQWMLHRYLLHSGIGKNFQQLSWADMVWCDADALKTIQDYIAHAPSYVTSGFGLFLYGGPGSGKTSLGVLGLKTLLGLGYEGLFTTFNELIDVFTSGWQSADDQRWFHARIKNAPVLVIDDPGKETKGRIELPRAVLDEVIRHRVSGLRPTFIMTNLDPKGFAERYGEYILSLLHERTATVPFNGLDARDNTRLRLHEEIDMGLTRPLVVA